MAEICATDGGADGIVFDASTLVAEPIRDDAEYHGLRVRFEGRLGGSRVPMQIDIGFGNHIEPPAEDVRYPTLLGGEEPRIRAYPTAAVVAEKLHAMVVLGERNSRIKDFYDVYVLARTFAFDGATLRRAVAATFARRATPVQATLPIALTPAFYEDDRRAQMWRAYQAKNGLRGAPAEFARVGEMVRGFLSQLLLSVAHEDRHTALWAAGGPWTVDVVAQGATVVISVSGSVAEVLPPADEDEVGSDHREAP